MKKGELLPRRKGNSLPRGSVSNYQEEVLVIT